MSAKIIYDRYKAEGKCRNCSTKLVGSRKGKSLCTKCAKKHSKYIKDNVKFFNENNLCPRCGKERLEGQEKMCPECRCKQWIYATEYRNTHPEFAKNKALKDKERRQFRIDNNLCVDCGVELVDTKFKRCEKCRIKRRIYAERYRRTKEYGLQELCTG